MHTYASTHKDANTQAQTHAYSIRLMHNYIHIYKWKHG